MSVFSAKDVDFYIFQFEKAAKMLFSISIIACQSMCGDPQVTGKNPTKTIIFHAY